MRPTSSLEVAVLRNLLTQTTRAYEDQVRALSEEKELAQVTLASIADGVITTGEDGTVQYLNPIAERLTGWTRGEAAGQPVEEVFRLVDEVSGAALDPTASAALRSAARATGNLLVRRDGQRFAVEASVAPIAPQGLTGGLPRGLVIVFQDVTDRRLLSLQLAHQASHDALTGLPNRGAFDARLRDLLDQLDPSSAEVTQAPVGGCLCYLDLDQFKLINDTCGHLAGDELLRRVSGLLLDEVRETDLVARLGGDEFGLLMPDCSLDEGRRIARRLHRAFQDFRFTWQDKSFAVTASVGLVPITPQSVLSQVLSAADHACYAAKEMGRNRVQVYHADDADVIRRTDEMNWVVRLEQTLEEERFQLYAQPIVGLQTQGGPRRQRFEVLVRMIDNGGRVLTPGTFIRAAERYGLMRRIDRWVVHNTLSHLSRQSPSFLEGVASCAINLSAVSVSDESFLEFTREELARHRVPPGKICFEITETAAVASLPRAQRLIEELSALSCRFALDDFGSGMSSYSQLKALRVSYLKIDRTFVRDLTTSSLDRAMLESILQMARALGIETVAEGVTSRALAERLREMGVDYAQGYWIGKPRPLAQIERGRGAGVIR